LHVASEGVFTHITRVLVIKFCSYLAELCGLELFGGRTVRTAQGERLMDVLEFILIYQCPLVTSVLTLIVGHTDTPDLRGSIPF